MMDREEFLILGRPILRAQVKCAYIFTFALRSVCYKEQFTSSHEDEQKPDWSIIMVKSTRRGSFHFNDCAAIYSVKVRICQVEDLLSSVSDVKMKNVCKCSMFTMDCWLVSMIMGAINVCTVKTNCRIR